MVGSQTDTQDHCLAREALAGASESLAKTQRKDSARC